MADLSAFWASRVDWFDPTGREHRIKEYLVLANQLIWQRQASFFAAAMLAAIYFDPISTFVCYAVVILTELLDQILGREAEAWDGRDPIMGRKIFRRVALNTAVSALAISVFIVNMAVQETSEGHFTALFFLFSASIFAAMYNSQIVGILLLRISIYGVAFLYIAFIDVVRQFPPLSSPVWLKFFTIIFVLYFIVDISIKFYLSYQERLQQMRRIKAENERTKAALEVKSQFLSTVSHELRTPLTSITGALDLVNNGVLGEVPDGLKAPIGIAVKNGHRLANLIDELLDLQKIEAGEMSFDLQPLNANLLVSEAVEAIAGYAAKLGIDVKTELHAAPVWLRGDHSRLIQVMNNLLSNALKFSHEGGEVRVVVEATATAVRLSVHDNGVGIPDDAKDRVFGRFSQVDSSDIRKVGGTGLGLHITKQIVDRHHASIDYTSTLGVGSIFFLEFERIEGVEDEGEDPNRLAKAG